VGTVDNQDRRIKAQIDAGQYTNERSGEIEVIRAALIEGETSGEPRPFDANAFKQRMLTEQG
jgi:antitoxin ParD1/3/4